MKYYKDIFKTFFNIERNSGSSWFKATKNATLQTMRIKEYHYKLVRGCKLTPFFFFANKYYTKAHDGAFIALRIRFLNEMIIKQKERSETNITVNNLLVSLNNRGPTKFSSFIYYMRILGKFRNYIRGKFKKIGINKIDINKIDINKIDINKIDINKFKIPQSINEKLQEWLLYSVKLYHESLQNLIEGQREVLKDKKFVFEDKKTVEDKMNTFEEYLKEKIPRFRRKKKKSEEVNEAQDKNT